jgi:hypothetical protein
VTTILLRKRTLSIVLGRAELRCWGVGHWSFARLKRRLIVGWGRAELVSRSEADAVAGYGRCRYPR